MSQHFWVHVYTGRLLESRGESSIWCSCGQVEHVFSGVAARYGFRPPAGYLSVSPPEGSRRIPGAGLSPRCGHPEAPSAPQFVRPEVIRERVALDHMERYRDYILMRILGDDLRRYCRCVVVPLDPGDAIFLDESHPFPMKKGTS